MSEYKTPTLAELQVSTEDAFKNDAFNHLLNQEPPEVWLRPVPFTKGAKDLPIDKVEYLLAKIFKKTRWEIKEAKQILNSVLVIGRLHYYDPVNDEWTYQDGVGAANMQMDAGAEATDLNAVKAGAIVMAAPIAAVRAKKDAADNIGRLFGRDLNRKNTVDFAAPQATQQQQPPQQKTENKNQSFNADNL